MHSSLGSIHSYVHRFTFAHGTISMTNAFQSNTRGKAVGAYTSLTLSLTAAFTPSSTRRLLRCMHWLPHSCTQALRAPRKLATEGEKEQVARSSTTRPPALSQLAGRAVPQLWLSSVKGRGYGCCTCPLPDKRAHTPPVFGNATLPRYDKPNTADAAICRLQHCQNYFEPTLKDRHVKKLRK